MALTLRGESERGGWGWGAVSEAVGEGRERRSKTASREAGERGGEGRRENKRDGVTGAERKRRKGGRRERESG